MATAECRKVMSNLPWFRTCLAAVIVAAGFASRVAGEDRGASIQTLGARPELPDGHQAPLCIVLPGGPGRMPQATGALRALGNDLAKRGWIVVVPVSPDGASFFGDAAKQVLRVMDKMEEDPEVRPGKVLLAGLSNGGIAALQVASMAPDRVSGVIAVPGVLHPAVRLSGLKHLPVYIRIGADDYLKWGETYAPMVRQLKNVGARLDAKLLQGIGHGVPIEWDEIDRWIERELGALAPAKTMHTEIALPSTAARPRVWTSRKGSKVTARLSKIEGNQVVLLRANKKPLRILRTDLSPEDDAYLTSLIKTAEELPGKAITRGDRH